MTIARTSAGTHHISGQRIYLREVRASDVNETYLGWMHDPEVTRYMESRFDPPSIDELRNYVSRLALDPTILFLAIKLIESDRHIGNIKVGPINVHHHIADVGLCIGEKDCWGRGYASEAIRLVSAYAFRELHLHKLTAGFYAPNKASQKAFLNAGYVQEGIGRDHWLHEGRFVDQVWFGLVRSEESR